MCESPRSSRRERALAGSPAACRTAPRLAAGRRATLAAALGAAALLLVSTAALAASRDAAGSASTREALPRLFSVEVAAGGALYADGTRLATPAELSSWAGRAVKGARFTGAVVFGDPGRDASAIAAAVQRLRAAGFVEVRSVGRPAPRALSAAREGALPLASARSVVATPAVAANSGAAKSSAAVLPARARAAVAPARKAAPPAPAVKLATVGLHVGSELNRQPHRRRLVQLFERQFDAFRRCHRHAERHDDAASFGVDLLVAKEGGGAKVREQRTRLKNPAFRSCMQAAFEAIRFAPLATGRPEIVSYSLLFEPPAR